MTTHHHTTHHRTHTAKPNGNHVGSDVAHFAMDELGAIWNKTEKSLKEHSSDAKTKILKYTKQHPITALGGAMLAGAFFALLFRR